MKSNTGSVPAGIPPDKWPDFQKELAARAWAAIARPMPSTSNTPMKSLPTRTHSTLCPARSSPRALSKAYVNNKQYDDAIATADKAMAMPDASPQVKPSPKRRRITPPSSKEQSDNKVRYDPSNREIGREARLPVQK